MAASATHIVNSIAYTTRFYPGEGQDLVSLASFYVRMDADGAVDRTSRVAVRVVTVDTMTVASLAPDDGSVWSQAFTDGDHIRAGFLWASNEIRRVVDTGIAAPTPQTP